MAKKEKKMIYTLLQAATNSAQAKQSSGASGMSTLIILILLFVVMYFLMIMPQQKKQKELQKMLDSLKENDKVVTTSGIYGRIVSIKPDKNTVVLEIDDNNHVRIEIQKGAIASIVSSAEKSNA